MHIKWRKKIFKKPFRFKSSVLSETDLTLEEVKRRSLKPFMLKLY